MGKKSAVPGRGTALAVCGRSGNSPHGLAALEEDDRTYHNKTDHVGKGAGIIIPRPPATSRTRNRPLMWQ